MRRTSRYNTGSVILYRGAEGVDGLGRDRLGEPLAAATPGAGITLEARVEANHHRVQNHAGEEVEAKFLVYLEQTYEDPDTGAQVELTIGAQDRMEVVGDGRILEIAVRERPQGWGWVQGGTIRDTGAHWELFLV